MTPTRRDLGLLAAAVSLAPGFARAEVRTPLVIASGAAAGGHPAGTRGAYELAIKDGADFIEADLVASQDGALVARRDHELSATTDVAVRSEFVDRRTTRTFDGASLSGWFAEDFTLAELKSLDCGDPRARRAGAARAAILSLQELIDIARAGSVRSTRVIGIFAGMKRPAYFASIGLPLEARLADTIRANGYDSPAAALFVHAFESEALKTFGGICRARRVQRLGARIAAADDLKAMRGWAEAVGPAGPLDAGLAPDAHAAGLLAFAWTAQAGASDLKAMFLSGVDGVRGDVPGLMARARRDAMAQGLRQRRSR